MRPHSAGRARQWLSARPGRSASRVFDALRELRPDWAGRAVDKGAMKIVFHGDADDEATCARTTLRPSQQQDGPTVPRTPTTSWSCSSSTPCCSPATTPPPIHTMYMDRPMKGANLMQALARVNRRFRGKQDGLLVGYAPLTENLRKAIAEYTPSDPRTRRSAGTSTGRSARSTTRSPSSRPCWRRRMAGDPRRHGKHPTRWQPGGAPGRQLPARPADSGNVVDPALSRCTSVSATAPAGWSGSTPLRNQPRLRRTRR